MRGWMNGGVGLLYVQELARLDMQQKRNPCLVFDKR